MGQSSFGFVLGVVVAGLCSTGSIGVSAEAAGAIPLVVIVHDRAVVPPETLDQALKEAARIYLQLGVALKWQRDSARVGPQAFSVQLIIQDKLRPASDLTEQFLMGVAVAPGRDCRGTVYLFNDQVAKFSSWRRIRPALAMGTVIAHEIGHVLLERKGHSQEGLMRAVLNDGDWERAVLGILLFAPHDAALIRANTSSCRR